MSNQSLKDTPTSVRFDKVANRRLKELSAKTKIPIKTLIELGVDWFLNQVDQGKSIPIPDLHAAEDADEHKSSTSVDTIQMPPHGLKKAEEAVRKHAKSVRKKAADPM